MTDRIYLNVPAAEKGAVKKLGAQFDTDARLWYIGPKEPTAPFTAWLWEMSDMSYWYGDLPVPKPGNADTKVDQHERIVTGFVAHMKAQIKARVSVFHPEIDVNVTVLGVDLTVPMNWLIHIGNERGHALCTGCQRMRRPRAHPVTTLCGPCTAAAKKEAPAVDTAEPAHLAVVDRLMAKYTRVELDQMCEAEGIPHPKTWSKPNVANAVVRAIGPVEATKRVA